MDTRDPLEQLWLDEHYGLLTPDESRDLHARLANEPAVVQAREKAQRLISLLSVAAKAPFPDIAFTPPVIALPATPTPAPATSRTAHKRSPAWQRWAVAAGIFLALGALSVPVGQVGLDYAEHRRAVQTAQRQVKQSQEDYSALVAAHNSQVEASRQRFAQAKKALDDFSDKLKDRFDAVEKAIKSRHVYMVVTGPETLQPGAPNSFDITTYRVSDNIPAPAVLTVKVRDQKTNSVLYKEEQVPSRGQHKVTLPADLPVTPRSQLALEVVATDDEGGNPHQILEQLQLSSVAYITHLTTDKPLYQPGETVRFRSLTLNRFSLKPPEEDFKLEFVLTNGQGNVLQRLFGSTELKSASGAETVKGPDGKPIKGIGTGEFRLNDLPGGQYTLTVSELNKRFLPQSRKFLINEYTVDRLEKTIEFDRKSYSAGDMVLANCKASDGNQPLVNQPVTASVNVDGHTIPISNTATDSRGCVAIRFQLPKAIERGAGTLTVVFTDGGKPEPITKPIPILVKKLSVDFYPEGGDLIAGVPNRVYFQVRSPLGKPADVKGRIVDERNETVATVATVTDPQPGISQGQGVCRFTPVAGQTYRLVPDQPADVQIQQTPMKPLQHGVALSIANGVTSDRDPITVRLQSPVKHKQKLLVGAYACGRLLDHQRITLEPGQAADVTLKPEPGYGGVTRVTVFEELAGQARRRLEPRAERLIYRQPQQKVNLTLKPDRPVSLPGEKVQLHVSATTEEQGRPTAAIVMVGVVNQSVISMADEKTARSMPTHFLLTSEVQRPEELEHADILLGDHPRSAEALDLLLGTQGWRRFAEQDPAKFREQHAVEAQRVLVSAADDSRTLLDRSIHEEKQKVLDSLQDEYNQTLHDWEQARAEAEHRENDQQYAKQLSDLQSKINSATAVLSHAKNDLHAFERVIQQSFIAATPFLGLGLLLLGLASLGLGAVRDGRQAAPYYATSTVCMGLCVILVGALSVLDSPDERRALAMADAEDSPSKIQMSPARQLPLGEARHEKAHPEGPAAEIRGGQFPPNDGAVDLQLLQPGKDNPVRGRDGPAAVDKNENKVDKDLKLLEELDFQGRDKRNFPPRKPGAAVPMPRQPGEPKFNNQMDQKLEPKGPEKAKGMPEVREAEANKERNDPTALLEPAEQLRLGANGLRNVRGRLVLVAPDGQLAATEPQRRQGFGFQPGKVGGKALQNATPAPAVIPLPGDVLKKQHTIRGNIGLQAENLAPPMIVREYAHVHQAPTSDGTRTDFTETVLWHPVLVLGEQGHATVSFDLADSVGRYRILAAAHTLDGRLGAKVDYLEARKPFSLEPVLPIEVTASDRIDVPVSLSNGTGDARSVRLRLKPEGLEFLSGSSALRTADKPDQTIRLEGMETQRQVFRFRPTLLSGTARLIVDGQSPPFDTDTIRRTVRVVPDGFPMQGAVSNILEQNAELTLKLPDFVENTLRVRVDVYPSPLADLQKGLEGLLREPHGCFEQTSTSNYPNLLILDYLQTSEQANPEATRRAKELLDRGYKKLVSFECNNVPQKKREGYEWFGGNAAPHEALTAYGLMQFRDLARVYDVDKAMVERTVKYLMSCKDGKGGFKRNPHSLDTFGRAPEAITNAYIVWALTESSATDDVNLELDTLAKQAAADKDPYFLALVANSLLNRDRRKEAKELLQKIAAAQVKGMVSGAQTSITGSAGRDLQIETTALALLGWLKFNEPVFTENVRTGIQWIAQQRGGYGGFGSTQSTILALKALIAFTKANRKPVADGELRLFIGNDAQPIAVKPFKAEVQQAISLECSEAATKRFQSGDNTVRLELTGGNTMPFTLSWEARGLKPDSSKDCAVRLTTKLDKLKVVEGDAVQLTATIKNVSGRGQGMTVAVIGLPAGLRIPSDFKQLIEHATLRNDGAEPGLISHFEVRGRELVLYWRDLAPNAEITVPITLECQIPGEYRGPASRAYLYYNADHKDWVEPLSVSIAVK